MVEMKKSLGALAVRWLTAACWVYFSILLAWFGLYLLTGDRLFFVAIVNTFAVYLFFPLPIIFALAFFLCRREVWVGVGIGALLFAGLWGKLFVPALPSVRQTSPVLTVMTYNMLGMHNESAPAVQTIRTEDADVVFLQELNFEMAKTLQAELLEAYPYQILDPQPTVAGMGTLSKYPIRLTGDELKMGWVGTPQVMALAWGEAEVTLVNFHMWPTNISPVSVMVDSYRKRELEAEALIQFAEKSGPIIAAGDANATPFNDAYRIVNTVLLDAWAEAGFGLGHTFPGSDIPGSSRPRIAGRPSPQWMLRIDYIFHSSHWITVDARQAAFDGVSDHRGVVAELALP